ncbi:MAG: hypothetical protein KIG95_05655 [Comamonas sp.]|nr:hypothetical protein [Comamonas sp.]
MTLNAWTGLQDPSTPKNIREGEPYTDPQFEELARTYGVWGTAQAALCAEFWQAARRAQVVPQGWKLVPVEPTQEMKRAGMSERHDDLSRSVYQAMLAAAPQPPEAAPVQLPEPWAISHHNRVQYSNAAWHGETPDGTKLYTEQQVRQLLADHGIQEQST